MDERQRNDLALFRFSLIAPLVNGSLEGSVEEYLEKTCAKTYDVPGMGSRRYSARTLRMWRSAYVQQGLEGLKMKPRKDAGGFRRLSPEVQAHLKDAFRRQPKLGASGIYEQLLSAQLLGTPPCSLSTVQRFLRTVDISTASLVDRRRFVFPYANSCWQSDVCVGPDIMVDGRRRQALLIAFLDDASRLCVHAKFYFSANSLAFEEAFKLAMAKRGIPQQLYVDNGKIFHATQLKLICARLGIILSHSKPYQPEGRGKVERMFRTFRSQFFERLAPENLESLEALNQALATYIERVYHSRVHSSLEGQTPMQRFMQDQDKLRQISTPRLNQAFLHQLKRQVRKDGTVSLNKVIFETPPYFVGQEVTLLFDPQLPDQAWIQTADSLVPVAPVRPVDNSSIPRRHTKTTIDWTALMHAADDDADSDSAHTREG